MGTHVGFMHLHLNLIKLSYCKWFSNLNNRFGYGMFTKRRVKKGNKRPCALYKGRFTILRL